MEFQFLFHPRLLAHRVNYQHAKKQMISALLKCVEAQNAGRLDEIEAGYDELDFGLPRNSGPEFQKLIDALIFWDCWIDARNHYWEIHEGLQEDDWPILATLIVADLEAEREIKSHLEKIVYKSRGWIKL
jgi:hypothetical protein